MITKNQNKIKNEKVTIFIFLDTRRQPGRLACPGLAFTASRPRRAASSTQTTGWSTSATTENS